MGALSKRRVLVVSGLAGAAGPALFTLAWVVAGLAQERYLWRAEDISDLAAPTADHTWIMTAGIAALGVGLVVFATGLPRLLGGGWLEMDVTLALGVGVTLLAAFPSDCSEYRAACREKLASGDVSLAHQVHNADTAIIFPLALLVPLLAAGRLGPGRRWLRAYSAATSLLALPLLGLYLLDPFPGWNGLLQRLFASVLLLWVAVLGWRMLAAGTGEVELVGGAVDQTAE